MKCAFQVASLVVCASASLVWAVPQVYRPAAPYAWNYELSAPTNYYLPPLSLDARNSPTNQSGQITPQSVFQRGSYPMTSGDLVTLSWHSGAAYGPNMGVVQFAVTPIDNFSSLNVTGPYNVSSYEAPRQYAVGNSVNSVGTWRNSVLVAWTSGFGGYGRNYTVWGFDVVNQRPTYTTVSNPDDFYAGLKLNLADGVHYGWMHAVWTTGSSGQGARYTIAAWGYETDVNMPIQIPTCATAADVNHDGTLDFFDYLDFVDAFSAGASSADFNQDSVVDFFDYLDFVDVFSAGC